jgi:hypothetical protein
MVIGMELRSMSTPWRGGRPPLHTFDFRRMLLPLAPHDLSERQCLTQNRDATGAVSPREETVESH